MKEQTSANAVLSGLAGSVNQLVRKGRSALSSLGRQKKSARSIKSTATLVIRGKQALRKVDSNSREAVILQHRTLLELLKENKDTEYGKKYGFADIHTVADYRKAVPFTTYDNYEPYIQRMMAGEERVLSERLPVYFALTSGSVGVPKYVPVSREALDLFSFYSVAMAFGVADEYYRNTTGRGVPVGPGLNTIEMKVMPTASGVDKGSISGSLMNSVKDFVPFLLSSPWDVVNPAEQMDMKYLKARLALAEQSLTFMDSAFMTGLVDMMDYIRANYKMLCKDIFYGTINEDVQVPQKVREALAASLTPKRARAKELMREFQAGFDTPIIPRIWPRMSWIGGIGTGGFASYAKKMRKYAGKSIPFNNLCYAASESFMAVARHMSDESYVLIPDGGFYEFIPVSRDEKERDENQTLTIEDLEVGEDYEIVVTNLSGFYRYRLGDVVRVTGYYNESPMIRFLYRKNQLISIAGEKTNEEALSWAVSEFGRVTGISILDYSVYADTDSEPGHYVVLMEPERPVTEDEIPWCRDVMEKKMMQTNPSYGDKIRNGVLKPLQVMFLEQQTYQLYRDLQSMRGVSPNQQKPVRVIDTPEKQRFFFTLAENWSEEKKADS